jgi:flagellar hook-basal body complex protein FliE
MNFLLQAAGGLMLPVQNAATLRATLIDQRSPMSPASGQAGASSDGVFSGMLQAAQQQINATDTAASQAVTGLLSGQGVEVHDAMIATEKADLTFQLALQVRNKAVAAYQQMMGMQF